jgi:hypothetical protein
MNDGSLQTEYNSGRHKLMLIYRDQEIHIIRNGETIFLEQEGKALRRPQWSLMIAGLFIPS